MWLLRSFCGSHSNLTVAIGGVRCAYVNDAPAPDGEPGIATEDPGTEAVEFVPGTFKPFQAVGICRPGDTAAVLDALAADTLNAGVALDTSRIAVAGWSGGSTTPMQLAGGSRVIAVGMEPYRVTPRDDVDAYVALSAQGAGFSNWYDQDYNVSPSIPGTSWDEVVGPFLSVTGVFDRANGMEAVDRLKPFENMPAGDKWLLYSDDDRDPLNHNSFDLAHADSPDAHAQDLTTAVTSTVIAFLDWHLRARPEAQAWLESDSAPDLLGAGGRWETK